MRKIIFSALILAVLNLSAFAKQPIIEDSLQWSQLPDLPDPLGVAGPFAGVHNDALIIAGGANFPQPIWETSKLWHDKIYVLIKAQNSTTNTYQWIEGFELDKPLAYGASVSTEHGLLCIGGNDGQKTYREVFLLIWDPEKKTISPKPLPSLPEACAYADAAQIGDIIYLAGGCSGPGLETATTNFWSLDLSKISNTESLKWEPLLPWAGPSRAFNLTVAQHNGIADCIYVFSGRRSQKDANAQTQIQFLTDVYEFNPINYQPEKYDPETEKYSGTKSPWRKRADLPQSVMAGTGIKVGQSHIFVLGGADGSLFDKANDLKDNHPGFPKNAFAYHTITNTWVNAGEIPANHVTTTALRWGNDPVRDPIIIPTGEIRPRVRSPKIWQAIPVKGTEHFGIIDFSTIGIYLTLMIAVGVFFSFRNKNSDDFFRGGRRVPWLVAGFSIFATMLSSITFIAVPAKTFATDWLYFLVNMTAVAVTPLVILLFLPFFRKIDAASAYEYLEKRFNRPVRLFASASFILFQIGRMAVVLYLPALALAAITPLTELQCILLMGVLSIIYCTMGGLEAVVWTDTIQSFVLLGGAFISLAIIIFSVQDGFSGFLSTAVADNKFNLYNWDFSSTSFATTALWVVVIGGLGQSLVPYTSDMAVIQRYMSVSSTARAKKAIWTNAIVIVPASLLFFAVGTALFVFYKQNPDRLDPTFKTDAIFPLFIARELPTGIAGLLVAGIFAAAQSTVSTSINSISACFVTDFVRPFSSIISERSCLRLGRLSSFAFGCLGVALALLFATSDIKSLWDQFMKILGLFGGSMCGLFCLGIFTRRANGTGAIIGAVIAIIVLYLVQAFTNVHFLLYASIGIAACFIAGYIISLIVPISKQQINGLTIYDLNAKQNEE